jgi:hypothetical protein
MDWMQIAVEYIKPELFILVFVLWYIGTLLKKSHKIEDWAIPFILMVISIIMALSWVLITSGITPMATWVGIMQGFVIAAVEGQAYQYFKQFTERKG